MLLPSTLGNTDSVFQFSDRPEKRRRIENQSPSGIQKFFIKSEASENHDDEFGSEVVAAPSPHDNEADKKDDRPTGPFSASEQHLITDYICKRCNQSMSSDADLQSHQDWHFARDLQDEERPSKSSSRPSAQKIVPSSSKRKPGHGNTEKG